MLVEFTDFNNVGNLFSGPLQSEWNDIRETLEAMPLHLKASDQAGIQGQPIFDVVGINQYISRSLIARSWRYNMPIPAQYAFLGTDIDYFKSGVIAEAQFSNYPFLLNNLLRSELFYKSKTLFDDQSTSTLVIITKAHMFPASNSTLYYEQAINQIRALTNNTVFDIPIRVVGLFSPAEVTIPVKWTTYVKQRSRTVTQQVERQAIITVGQGANSRTTIMLS